MGMKRRTWKAGNVVGFRGVGTGDIERRESFFVRVFVGLMRGWHNLEKRHVLGDILDSLGDEKHLTI